MVETLKEIVRPVLAFMFGGAAVYGFAVGIIAADAFLALVGVIVTFYFEEKAREKLHEENKELKEMLFKGR